MPDPVGKNSELLTLYEFLSGRKMTITIPIIQRDYAQGRDEKPVKVIRERFLDELVSAVDGSHPLILDFVYGAMDENSFIPIDGQQRLTTLFLLHWYLAVLEKKEPGEYSYLKNFTYEIRENAREFCHALASGCVDLSQRDRSLSQKIRNASWYHYVYDSDPTVQSMLNMLDAIDERFYGLEGKYENLVEKGVVSFWWLPLKEFGLTDDLFIKMNARGKSLTRFELFKAEVEQATESFRHDDKLKHDNRLIQLSERWLDSIDNDWLDAFWAQTETPQENAEDRLFMYILFLLRTLAAEKNGEYEDIGKLEETNTKNDIQTICDKENLEFVCDALDAWKVYSGYQPVKDMFLSIISKDKSPTFLERAVVFGVIAYGNRQRAITGNRHPAVLTSDAFFRMLKYLVIGHRSADENSKKFGNALNAANYGSFIGYLRHFINGIQTSGDDTDLLQSMTKTPDNMATFRHAIEKAEYCLPNGEMDQSRHEEIREIEDMPCFCGQIHNVLFDGKLWLTPQQIKQLIKTQESNPGLLLQCIQAMSKNTLFTYGYYNFWKQAKVNGKEEQFRLYKYFFGFSPSDFGDYLWTSNNDLLSNAVRGFIRECAELSFTNLEKELKDWLEKKRNDQQNYSDLAPYIMKYDEFLGHAGEKADGCVYLEFYYTSSPPWIDWTRVFIDPESGRDYHAFWRYKAHYNPFIMALHNRLEAENSKIRIINQWMCNEQEAHALDKWVELSNGQKLRLMIKSGGERYWELENGTVWDYNGTDCIEAAYDKIIAMN